MINKSECYFFSVKALVFVTGFGPQICWKDHQALPHWNEKEQSERQHDSSSAGGNILPGEPTARRSSSSSKK